jgi:protein-S-isoprenylcysteine O-methyltransferase Ste14
VGEHGQLIANGPYRSIRHPRYLGGIIYAFGLSLLFRSWIGIVASVVSLGVFWFRIRDEEILMHQEFGQEWEAYCQQSWRLIPFLD